MVQIIKLNRKIAALAVISTTLAGCAGQSNSYRPPVEERGKSPQVVQPAKPAVPAVNMNSGLVVESHSGSEIAAPVATPMTTRNKKPAVIALLENAQKQRNNGQLRAAETSLERAQRIAPRDPDIYFQLAQLRKLEGQFLQAEQLALKGADMAIGDPISLRRVWLLIADIRELSGNRTGAKQAERKAMSY